MGWFDEQIRQRMKSDDDAFSDSFLQMAELLTETRHWDENADDALLYQNAVVEILRYFHIKPQDVPPEIKTIDARLEYLLRPNGVMRREIQLKGRWYQDGIGPMLGKTKDGEPIALIPKGFGGYTYFDCKNGKRVTVTKSNKSLLSEEAICFYKPFPLKSLGLKDLFCYILETLAASDFVMVGAATLAVTLVGLVTPKVNQILFSDVVSSGSVQLLFAAVSMLIGAMIASLLFGAVNNMVLSRISTKLSITVQSAAMMRLLSLPAGFFKEYSSGEIGERLNGISELCTMLASMVLSTGFAGVFSLIYIGQIFSYAPSLVMPALAITTLTLLLSTITTLVQMKLSLAEMKEAAKERGLIFSLISGIQKIKLAGAEKRAFSKWTQQYLKSAKYTYTPPMFIRLNSVLLLLVSGAGTIALYFMAVKSQIGVADYMAFNASYGMVSGAFAALSGIALSIANIKPQMEMITPILKAVPEVSGSKKVVTRLTGGIELNNVSFRYKEDMPLILDNVSLKIRPGQYVAVVGKTGCGKSTLMRLLLGFETPQKGAVYYDGKDIGTMDLKSLRQHMGVVIQDGRLFSGDIYSNITISAPTATLDDAWKAAEMAGMDKDIRNMPMGMHTLISEGSGGISGGQRQRLMIARAVAPNPRILLLDEATSALDNITQKIVSESLAKLKCTRIVIAHRLSTIKECDRIITLEGGHIVEDGTYEELIQKNGVFASLVKRQRLDNESE